MRSGRVNTAQTIRMRGEFVIAGTRFGVVQWLVDTQSHVSVLCGRHKSRGTAYDTKGRRECRKKERRKN